MHASYLKTFSPKEIEHHAALMSDLSDRQPVRVEAAPLLTVFGASPLLALIT